MILVALHGHPLDRRMWLPLGAELGEAMRLFAPDLRGRGTSRRHAAEVHPMSLLADDVAQDIEDLLDPGEPLVLCGLSMGGYVLFELLRRHGRKLAERVTALVLCGTRATADDAATRERRAATVGAIAVQGMEAVRAAMVPKLLAAGGANEPGRAAIEEVTRAMILDTPPETACADLVGMAARGDSFDVLSAVSVPTLLVFGEEDVITPPTDGEAMAEALGNAPYVRFLTVPDAAHLAPLERPRDVANSIRELLARV